MSIESIKLTNFINNYKALSDEKIFSLSIALPILAVTIVKLIEW